MRVLENGEPPIPLDLARQHLRVGSATHDDTLIAAKLDMAVAVAEDMTGRFIRQRSFPLQLFPPTKRLTPKSRQTVLRASTFISQATALPKTKLREDIISP